MPNALTHALREKGIPFDENVSLSKHTTLRVGGPADYLVHARCAEDIIAVLLAAKEATPLFCVGNGSNLLVLDGGIRGCVVVIGNQMSSIQRNGNALRVEAGAMLSAVSKAALSFGLSGMEALSGIPGTIGGAAAMNAGAYDQCMAEVVSQVEALDESGNRLLLSGEALCYGYRTSALSKNKLIAISVTLSLQDDNPEEIDSRMKSFSERRRQRQPLHMPSAGSFFKRPTGHFAGALIEKAGLKGVSVGGAQVSPMHAGFLVNTGNATARDFVDLMHLIQEKVQQMSGVALEPEVKILGCNSSC